MLENEFFRTLDFMTLPPDGGVSALDGNFALYDNIDNDLRPSSGRMDKGLCHAGCESPAEKRKIYGTAGQ